MHTTKSQTIMPRKAGFITGLSILALIYPAMVALTTLENTKTAGGFGSSVWIMLGIVVTLDAVVSVALGRYFAPVARTLARAIMVSRLVYTAIFAVAILQLIDASQSLAAIARFNDIWHASLLVFGIHLLLIGVTIGRLAFVSGHLSKATGAIVGGLLLIGGVGYLIDNIGLLFIHGYATSDLMMAALTAGETLFAVWILIKNLRK